MKINVVKFLPIIFIFIVWFVFAYPYFLKNKVPFPSTYQVNNFAPWSAYEKFWGPVKNGAMPDIITQIYPWKHLVIDAWKKGEIPLWNPYSFGGSPLLANYQSAALSPFNLLFLILPFVDAWSLLVLIQPLLAALFMYLLARSFEKSKIGSLISSVSFMFCGFITTWMGYATLGFAILYLPLSLYFIEKYHRSGSFRYLIFLTLSIPLSFFSGHFQISLYFFIAVIGYILYKLLTTKNLARTVNLAIHMFLGLLISLAQLLPSIELYLQSARSVSFQRSEIIPWEYLITFLAPDFFGNPVTRNDWFGHYAEWNAYVGVAPFILAVYAILSMKRIKLFFVCAVLAIIILSAFPSPLQDLFTNLHIPVFSTSASSRIIVIYSFLFATLASFGYDFFVRDIKNNKIVKPVLLLAIFSLIFILLWVIVIFKLFILEEKIGIARNNIILPTLIFGTILILAFVSFFKKLTFTLYLLLVIVSFDMLRFSIKWMPFDPKDLVFPKTETSEGFSKISRRDRVLGNLGGEASMYYRLPSVEGYDALHIKEYAEFMSFVKGGDTKDLTRSVVAFPKNDKHTKKAINLLNIKYIVHKIADDHAVWTFPYWTYPKGQFELIYKDSKYEFYENTKAFPSAFLVGKYRVINEKEKAIKLMFDDKFDLQEEIVLEKDPKVSQTNNLPGNVKILKHSYNYIDIQVDAKSDALLFLSDNFHNGWQAVVDRKKTPILKANYTFKALAIKKGNHLVKFYYLPKSFRWGMLLSIAGVTGVIVIYFFSRRGVRKTAFFS